MIGENILNFLKSKLEPRGILIGLEPHQQYSKTPDGLDRIQGLVKSPAIGINFDTGNAYLAGQDPMRWLLRVKDRLVHLHAKDISGQQSQSEQSIKILRAVRSGSSVFITNFLYNDLPATPTVQQP